MVAKHCIYILSMMYFFYRGKVLNKSRMQLLVTKGNYFGATNKFQTANNHAIKQAFQCNLNAYGEF